MNSKHEPKLIRKTLMASSVALALGAPSAQAALVTDMFGPVNWSTGSGNFTMVTSAGGTVGGTNNVSMVWDGNGYNASSDYTGPGSAANITASSTTPFFGHTWTAHDIQVFVPGSYTFDTTLGGGVSEAGLLSVTVPVGQIGMHMLFDWNGGNNIDVFVVAATNTVFGPGISYSLNSKACTAATIKNCLWDYLDYGPAGKPIAANPWMLASVDGNGDGIMGIPMPTGGPFAGFNANFNATMTSTPDAVVPVPAAVWLFGSGLMGLAAVARRKKKA